MTYLHTCIGCATQGICEKATSLRDAIQGLGIYSLKHKCQQRVDRYAAGQPVAFSLIQYNGNGDGETIHVAYAGHVVRQVGGKVIGFIKPLTTSQCGLCEFEARSGGYVKIPLARVLADASRPAADAAECKWCGNHPRLGARCNNDPEHSRGGCLADSDANNRQQMSLST